MTPRGSLRHYRRRQQVTGATLITTRRLWRRVDRTNPRGSWASIAPRLGALTRRGKRELAGDALDELASALRELGLPDEPVGAVQPDAIADVASDGRDLDSLLEQPLLHAERDIAAGRDPGQALDSGLHELERIMRTQLADSSRQATSVGITGRPDVQGWTRMLVPPSCSRCVILAGRWYAWNEGFLRHPNCDCQHLPAAQDIADQLLVDPMAYFNALSPADQDRTFGKTGAQAVRDGANIYRVVNARRGMSTTRLAGRDLLVTSERARGRRGRGSRGPRLMPESIYAVAGSDRAEALRLLEVHGFLLTS